jgi:hypothetical protein
MISVGINGGTDTVYSARFGLTGMTGVLNAAQLQGITAAGSDTTYVIPAAHGIVTAGAAAGTTAAAAVPEAGLYTVPYNLQTGFIKYAPMQPIPGTKITKKTASMMNPSSAFTIFTTYAPPASITYTVTESQTLTHSSRENPVSFGSSLTLLSLLC